MGYVRYSDEEFLRKRRNELLLDSDYTQLPDSPFTEQEKQEWIIYRQALRDLPSNTLDFSNIVWPTKPAS